MYRDSDGCRAIVGVVCCCLFCVVVVGLFLGTFLVLLGAAAKRLDEGSGVDHALVVDGHALPRVVALPGGELLSPGHESVSQPAEHRQLLISLLSTISKT